MAAYSEIPLESLTAGDVYVTGKGAKQIPLTLDGEAVLWQPKEWLNVGSPISQRWRVLFGDGWLLALSATLGYLLCSIFDRGSGIVRVADLAEP